MKRFVMDSSVVEDSAPATASPVNEPSLAPKAAIVILSSLPSELAVPAQSTGATRKVYNPAKAHHQRKTEFSHDNRRRWVWGNSIIQDGDEDAPSENANLLSCEFIRADGLNTR